MNWFKKMLLMISIINMVLSPVMAAPSGKSSAQTDQNQDDDGTTARFREWFSKKKDAWKEKWNSKFQQQEGPSYEDSLRAVIPEKASTLVERSMILAIQQITAREFQSEIDKVVSDVYDKYGSYIVDPKKVSEFTQFSIDEITKKIFTYFYQKILNEAHGIATGNLAKWSKNAATTTPQYFTSEYKLYDLVIEHVNNAFKEMSRPQELKSAAGLTMSRIRTAVVDNLTTVATATYERGDNAARSQDRSGKKIPGSSSTAIVDLSNGNTKDKDSFSNVNVEIPAIDVAEVLAQNPETLKYKLRKPLAGVTHFATQSALFNIPFFFVTVAMVGLDSPRDPLALDRFIESLKDPAFHMGFGIFSLTNHHVAVGMQNIIKNPGLRFLIGPVGMAAGMVAQTVFSDLWSDKNLRGCARSIYAPAAENSESCNKFWNDWILTNKISQYTPAVMGLLSTAFAAGLLQKYGGAALNKASQAVVAAEAELARLLNEAVANDPRIQKAKVFAAKGAQKAMNLKDKIQSKEQVQKLIELAKLQVQNAKDDLHLTKEYAKFFKDQFGEGWALAKGRLNVKVVGIWAIAKTAFRSKVELEAYLIKLKKLKGLVNFSIGTIGANLVFLAIDPFASAPISKQMGRWAMTDFNLKEFLDNNTLLDNYSEIVSTFFSHKIQLPHEKNFQTIPDIFAAYNKSLDYFLDHNFKGYDITKCYLSDEQKPQNQIPENKDEKENSWIPEFVRKPLESVKNEWNRKGKQLSDSKNAVTRYLWNQGLYFMNPDCVVESNFRTWLDKYAEAEKAWRLVALSKVISSQTSWMETTSNFLKNYETTRDFYTYMVELIHEYREKKQDNLVAQLPEKEISRSAILAEVMELSKTPLRSNWSENDAPKFEKLFSDKVGDFETPEYGDFMVASMACGPDPRQPISFVQYVKSLSWIRWESLSHLAPSIFSTWQTIEPNSPIIETYPGTSFRYIPPRITTGNPDSVCNKNAWQKATPQEQAMHEGEPEIYSTPLKPKLTRYQNLIHYIFENAREDIVNSPEFPEVHNFDVWNGITSTMPIYDERYGVWPVVKKNYENLMKYEFFPALNDKSFKTACPQGGMRCALTEDIYVRPNGLIYSGINELYTYIRTLRKILVRLAQMETKKSASSALDTLIKEDFETKTRALITSLIEASSNESYNYKVATEKLEDLELLRNTYFEKIPMTEEGLSALLLADTIFDKMNSVIGELEGYKRYSKLTLDKGEMPQNTPELPKEKKSSLRINR